MATATEVSRKTKTVSTRKQKRAAQRMKNRLLTIVLVGGSIFAVVAFFFISVRSDPNIGVRRPVVGQPMSNLVLKDLNGKTVHLSDYAGKPVLMNAWATWCPPCKAELPELQSFYEQHKSEGFVMLAVNAGEDKGSVSLFISQQGYTFPVVLDPNTTVLNRMGISSFPTSILVGKDGNVKGIHVGMFTTDTIQSELVPLLSN